MAAICRARVLSDLTGKTACDKPATSVDGRLCAFHSRQCQALYRGYKKRNAQLDALSESLPSYLAQSKTSLVVQEFKDIDDEAILRELHDYLFRKYNLIERVIRGRKLHHSHFFAIDNDYGHEKYLTQLQSEKHVIARALERLGKRGAVVTYKQKKWLKWVQQCQEDEEEQRENESRKVKLEALLFKRHRKEIDRHQREVQAKEERKRQEEFLEEAYNRRLSEMSEEDEDEWDPVQDVFGYERDNYVDLIKYFLMLKDQDESESSNGEAESVENNDATASKEPEKPVSKSAKKRAKKANAEEKKLATLQKSDSEGRGPKTIDMETKAQMRQRLRQPVKYERASGWYFAGSEGNMGIDSESPPLPDEEVAVLLEEIAEIKNLLFCRLLLSHAALLPIALEANSIEEFLDNGEVTQEHLRDLSLKLERPKLQDVRDACADFVRGENDEYEGNDADCGSEDGENAEDEEKGRISKKYELFPRKGRIPDKYQTKREEAARKKRLQSRQLLGPEEPEGILDFGRVTNESEYATKRMRIKICGRYMYNYPSEKALGRGGWFHFSIIAKDSDLYDAIELCRNWNEFFELNILCTHHYFPAAKWTIWVGDILRLQLLTLGFIPYFLSDKADRVTHHFQTGSRGMARRSHQIFEVRNFICGHIKRDDPVSRRFIQYLSMETFELMALVRDPKTGRVLIQPPEDELWLIREKSGWGRASRNEFRVISEVGPAFFEKMDNIRKWHFSFDEYYDVYVWDADPGRPYLLLQRKLEEVLMRALRVREHKDCFNLAAPILKTITKDPKTERARTIKPGEEVKSVWDSIETDAKIMSWSAETGEQLDGIMDTYKYTEADELEDAILFPEEATGEMKNNLFKENRSAMDEFERKPPFDIRRFANDLDTDDEVSDEDLDDIQSDDGDDQWDTEESSGDEDPSYDFNGNNDAEKAMDVLSKQYKAMTLATSTETDYFLNILRHPSAAFHIPPSIRNHPADLMATLRLSMMRLKEYNSSHAGMEADLIRHIDREKSKVFKKCWHMADFEPGARAKYAELVAMVKKMDDFVMSKITAGPFELCAYMRMARHFTEERRVVTDAFEAFAAVALFFDTDAFLESEHGQMFKDSMLFNQAERAKHLPDRRTHMSNKTIPKEFWSEWDHILRSNDREAGDHIEDIYPKEWGKAIRPLVIRLFKAGIICNSYAGEASGMAIAKAETNRPLDLYIDFRVRIPLSSIVSHLQDPTRFDRSKILSIAREFAKQFANARFAVLRLWSAPHFYPLMLGYEKRTMCSFLDDRGRVWNFRFIPKDMPYSEWSVHQQLSLRLEPYKVIFGSQVMVAKDLVLVMGKDEKDLRKLCEGVTWAIQTKPWRLEVDFWRSFLNVDFKFLEELHEKWLE
ncbi:hypothetical protein K469DRAFT_692577 [Zopfia rhizophila CBS 207.26]|uniref:Uncharacterized protein n=1 Tax=Zopfia rhizophila CBS 207.26 TaxID=1314779 RepID=A0A6A6DQR3_9PEZI|nr:hypothetical protein K469DRAFT_692577 [Zopfia rhizophila CBS 207.26]